MVSASECSTHERSDAVYWLGQTRLFAGAAAEDVSWLAARVERRAYAAGDALVRPGQPADGLLVIVAGRVLVDAGPEGGGVHVAIGPGDTLGELAALEGVPHTVAAVACAPTEALFLPREALLELLTVSRTLAPHLLAIVAGWARRADERAAELALRSPGTAPFAFRRLRAGGEGS